MDIEGPQTKILREMLWVCKTCGLTRTMHRYMSPRRLVDDKDNGDCDPHRLSSIARHRPHVYQDGGGI